MVGVSLFDVSLETFALWCLRCASGQLILCIDRSVLSAAIWDAPFWRTSTVPEVNAIAFRTDRWPTAAMGQLFNSLVYAAAPVLGLLLVVTLVEFVSPKDPFSFRDRLPGGLLTVLTPIFSVLAAWPLSQLWGAMGFKRLVDLSSLGFFGALIAFLLIHDLLRYIEHRFEHRFIWPIHAVHHSETRLNAANSFAHPLFGVSEFVIIIIPLSLVFPGPGVGLLSGPIAAMQSLLIHSPTRVHFGPLRRVLVDNRFHRIHHSLEDQHFDKNFGILFTIWDQMFGTAYFPKADEWPDTGVAGLKPPRSLRSYLLHPIATMRAHRDQKSYSTRSI